MPGKIGQNEIVREAAGTSTKEFRLTQNAETLTYSTLELIPQRTMIEKAAVSRLVLAPKGEAIRCGFFRGHSERLNGHSTESLAGPKLWRPIRGVNSNGG